MMREDFFRALGEIDERFVEETVKDFENGIFYEEGIGMSVWRKVCLAAACLALVAIGSLVIFIRSRSGGIPTPPLSGNTSDSISEASDSVSSDTGGFTEINRTGKYPEWLDDFDYNTDFYVKPNADIKPFTGSEKDDTPICTINNKDNYPNIFCYGGNMVYFYLRGSVYEYNPAENTTVKVFDGIAYNLNYRDGILYYIIDPDYKIKSRDIKNPSGQLWRYDLHTGEAKQLTEFDVSGLVVTDDGIYFLYIDRILNNGENGYVHMCSLDEETGKCERLYSNFSYIEYGGYRLKWLTDKDATAENPSPFVLEKDGVQYAMPEGFFPNRDCIYGDDYYFIANIGHSLSRMNMLTGEITAQLYDKVVDDDPIYDGAKWFVCADYTVLDGEIYYLNGSGLLCHYNEETGEAKEYRFQIPMNGVFQTVYMRYLYTDGKSIYAVTGQAGPSYDEPQIVRIDKTEKDFEIHHIEI